MGAAAATAALCLLLVAAVPARLACARWPGRAPSHALVLWQALGLAGGLLAIELTGTLALWPYGDSHLGAVQALLGGRSVPGWERGLSVLAGLAALLLFGRLLSVLVVSAWRTLRARRRHRLMLDLVSTRNPLLARARVLDHDLPLAYCLPGMRARVVLSRGVLDLLREEEVRAVLAHETAHLQQRHDLVVLPFVALGATFPRLSAVRTALTQVALLIEMLADDRAVRSHQPQVLARALHKVGAVQVPAGGLGVAGVAPASRDGDDAGRRDDAGSGNTGSDDGGSDYLGSDDDAGAVLLRAARLVHPPSPLGPVGRTTVLAAAVLVLALPVIVLLVPLLAGAS